MTAFENKYIYMHILPIPNSLLFNTARSNRFMH